MLGAGRVGPGPLWLALGGWAAGRLGWVVRAAGPRSRSLPSFLPSLSAVARVKAVWPLCSAPQTSGASQGARGSVPASLLHFPVIKTGVENRSSFFPRALAVVHTLGALLGRRIRCFGVCHSGLKLFLLAAPSGRCNSAFAPLVLGGREPLGSRRHSLRGLVPAACRHV